MLGQVAIHIFIFPLRPPFSPSVSPLPAQVTPLRPGLHSALSLRPVPVLALFSPISTETFIASPLLASPCSSSSRSALFHSSTGTTAPHSPLSWHITTTPRPLLAYFLVPACAAANICALWNCHENLLITGPFLISRLLLLPKLSLQATISHKKIT